jgi:5'-nucleotidase
VSVDSERLLPNSPEVPTARSQGEPSPHRSGPAAIPGPTPTPPQVALGHAQPPAAVAPLVEPSQLTLPMPELIFTPERWSIPRYKRVFVNRNLHLADTDWIGFDMDYTLAIYDQPQMDELQIRCTLPRLVARGYPEFLKELPYDISFPIRGLMIDKKLGHILKMDRYKVVHKAFHGLRELDAEQLRALYHQRKIRLTAARYHWIDTLYALSEVTMYAHIIEAMESRGLAIDYARLFEDIRESIDEAHRDGTVLEAVANDYQRYVIRDPDLAQTLHKWRSAGKKLFLLTNSRGSYTERMMEYLLGGSTPEYPTWRHFFDAVVCSAAKPAFFQERRPLMERDGDQLRPTGAHLERGKMYEGGNLHDFERLLGVTGDRVLYVGDHIYGDILRSKKESTWRTAMIIQEMTAEVLAHVECEGDIEYVREVEDRRQKAEDELRFLQIRFKELSRQVDAYNNRSRGLVPAQVLEAERMRVKKGVERVRTMLRTLDAEIAELEGRIDKRFHGYWGSLLKEANETSSFGSQVEEYACVYTSKVTNFLAYSPLQFYRSPRDRMAHEM